MLGSAVLRRHLFSSYPLLSTHACRDVVAKYSRYPLTPLHRKSLVSLRWHVQQAKQVVSLPGLKNGAYNPIGRSRGICTSPVSCSASQPKSVRDIVRELKKGDVTITFARSGGAGGQNVNKVNTKVDMRLNVALAGWMSEVLKDALQRLYLRAKCRTQEKKRINKEGELVVTSTATRSQADNIEDALEKMQACIDNAAQSLIPAEIDPEKVKQIEKQKRIANENRIDNKKKTSEKKQQRRAKIEW